MALFVDGRLVVCHEVEAIRFQQDLGYGDILRWQYWVDVERQHAATCPQCLGLGFVDTPEYKEWLKEAG